jgi:hypothetical protein
VRRGENHALLEIELQIYLHGGGDTIHIPSFRNTASLLYFLDHHSVDSWTFEHRWRLCGELACRDLPGANETLVVLKTGAGEIEEKLPIHLQTTFKCYPDTVVFPDFGETFMNHTIVDVLEDVDPKIKDNHDDFDLYRRLRRNGRAALSPSELSGSSSDTSSSNGKPTVPGWTLDK